MKKLLKKMMAFALAGVMAISVLGISVFAAPADIITLTNSSDKTKATEMSKTDGGKLCSDGCYIITNKGTIQFDSAVNGKLSEDDQAAHRQQALNKLGSAGFSSAGLKLIEKGFKNKGATDAELLTSLFANTKADLFTAMKWFSPFQGTVGLILGIGVIFIILLLIASTAFDLVYIGLPMARNVMDGKAEQSGKPRPFGVSTDAVRVVNDNEGDNKGTGGNMYVAYFKKRVVTYIILAICILYLVSGQLSNVIGWLLGQVSGIGS